MLTAASISAWLYVLFHSPERVILWFAHAPKYALYNVWYKGSVWFSVASAASIAERELFIAFSYLSRSKTRVAVPTPALTAP